MSGADNALAPLRPGVKTSCQEQPRPCKTASSTAAASVTRPAQSIGDCTARHLAPSIRLSAPRVVNTMSSCHRFELPGWGERPAPPYSNELQHKSGHAHAIFCRVHGVVRHAGCVDSHVTEDWAERTPRPTVGRFPTVSVLSHLLDGARSLQVRPYGALARRRSSYASERRGLPPPSYGSPESICRLAAHDSHDGRAKRVAHFVAGVIRSSPCTDRPSSCESLPKLRRSAASFRQNW